MYGHHCVRCRQYWASTANPELFVVIADLCPNCVEKMPAQLESQLERAG